mmetsp:Transcript_47944/g.88207  ORF Transcript_47944/g.88207 Transcript_47944/m.88207 type:complete len:227 (-) Transcript_47944:511-1191(-)
MRKRLSLHLLCTHQEVVLHPLQPRAQHRHQVFLEQLLHQACRGQRQLQVSQVQHQLQVFQEQRQRQVPQVPHQRQVYQQLHHLLWHRQRSVQRCHTRIASTVDGLELLQTLARKRAAAGTWTQCPTPLASRTATVKQRIFRNATLKRQARQIADTMASEPTSASPWVAALSNGRNPTPTTCHSATTQHQRQHQHQGHLELHRHQVCQEQHQPQVPQEQHLHQVSQE